MLLRFSALAFCVFLTSCIVNRSFVPTGHTPIMVEKKKETVVSLKVAPFNLFSANYEYAFLNSIALRGVTSVAGGIFSDELGAYKFWNREKIKLDFGAGFAYQNNHIRYNKKPADVFGLLGPGENYYTQTFNMTYYSAYTAGSFLFKPTKGFSCGLSCKASYNYAGNYNYYQRVDSYQGIDNPTPLNLEVLNEKPYPFVSLEPAINMLWGRGNLKFHVSTGYNWRFASLNHSYWFQQNNYSRPLIVEKRTEHPTMKPVTLFLGVNYVFGKRAQVSSN